MKTNPFLGLLAGLLFTAPLAGVMYAADQLADLPFIPFTLFDWFSRVLPGDLLTFGIDLMIDSLILIGGNEAVTNAKLAEQVMAVAMFLTIGIVLGFAYFALVRWTNSQPGVFGAVGLSAVFGVVSIATGFAISPNAMTFLAVAWLVVLFLLWGFGVNWAASRLQQTTPQDVPAAEKASVEQINRRQFLIRLGASTATITAVSGGLGGILARSAEAERRAAGNAGAAGATNITSFPNDGAAVVPAPGTRPEYTPVPDHYQVFIRTEPSVIDETAWTLPITGMVDNPVELTLQEIRDNYPPRNQFVTLSCISGRIGTSLISTTMWTGVSAQELLETVGVQDGAKYLRITSEDGFYETVALDLINSDERIMFAYDWDGRPIPTDHGFPLRIWIPDLYGMKQPKWIIGIEVTDEYEDGYWVERNWSREAQVKMTSVIDTVALDERITEGGQTLIPVGGIAFSGDRQISRVEVRVDGQAWQEAQLREPLSETTWVIWRYEWPFEAGEHVFEVRCYDGAGEMQITERTPQRPDGATGIHNYEI